MEEKWAKELLYNVKGEMGRPARRARMWIREGVQRGNTEEAERRR